MRILELFSGTGSVGTVARQMGHATLSVDSEPCLEPTLCANILTMDFKSLPVPDFIWASPPCTTYSYAAIWFKHRDSEGRALTKDARQADRILRRTMRIIRYFQGKNPALRFCVENPRGYMRKQPAVRRLTRQTTSYNNYGYPVCKATDFFTNYALELPAARRSPSDLRICGSNMVGIRNALPRSQRKGPEALSRTLGRIPPRLIRTILKQADRKAVPRSRGGSGSPRRGRRAAR